VGYEKCGKSLALWLFNLYVQWLTCYAIFLSQISDTSVPLINFSVKCLSLTKIQPIILLVTLLSVITVLLLLLNYYFLTTVQAGREKCISFQQQAHITYQPQDTSSPETEAACQLVSVSC